MYRLELTKEQYSLLEQLSDYLRYTWKFKDLDNYNEEEMPEEEIIERSYNDFETILSQCAKIVENGE